MARTSKRLFETFETPVYFVQYKKTNKMGILPIQFMERRATYPSPQLDPTNHDYAQNEDGFLYTFLAIEQPIPSDFPHPCTCLKCARETVCSCRVQKLKCCGFCKCGNECRNPYM